MARFIQGIPKVNTLPFEKQMDYIDRLYQTLYWTSPVINPQCGQNSPPTQLLRAGLIAYADGTNWNPGSGEGWYGYNSAGTWVKLG